MGIARLGYVVLQMKNPDAWAGFAETVLGFKRMEREDAKGAAYLRMDEAPFRYMVEQGEEEKFLAAGYELASEADYEALISKLEAAEVEVARGDAQEAERRAVAAFAVCHDPSGNTLELCHGRENGAPFEPGAGVSGFVTGDMGLGHLVIPAPANEETEAFYTQLCGFGISDDLTLPPPAESLPDQRILFLHADNPRHHTLGLYNFPNPTGVIHLMAEMKTMDDVGYCMDRVKQAGLHIFASLGRHSNDEMVSFYFFAPGGIGIEIGYDGLTIEDWSKFTPTKSTSGDYWGHEYDFPQMGD